LEYQAESSAEICEGTTFIVRPLRIADGAVWDEPVRAVLLKNSMVIAERQANILAARLCSTEVKC